MTKITNILSGNWKPILGLILLIAITVLNVGCEDIFGQMMGSVTGFGPGWNPWGVDTLFSGGHH